ncbi:MAG TPA: trypsin-like serine protease [Sandaracinaceae bacterium LLY-WYZ-13_1]|nr:trypsin-like serine protease [Sandaracinaceae bacterium LLY-WYZ-13_1]
MSHARLTLHLAIAVALGLSACAAEVGDGPPLDSTEQAATACSTVDRAVCSLVVTAPWHRMHGQKVCTGTFVTEDDFVTARHCGDAAIEALHTWDHLGIRCPCDERVYSVESVDHAPGGADLMSIDIAETHGYTMPVAYRTRFRVNQSLDVILQRGSDALPEVDRQVSESGRAVSCLGHSIVSDGCRDYERLVSVARVTHGDSGGPVLQNGMSELVAINVSDHGDHTKVALLGHFASWLNGVMTSESPTDDVCSGVPSGRWCAESLGGPSGVLLTCSGGVTIQQTTCSAGCVEMPRGTADRCAVESTSDPCSNAASGDGYYCGESIGGEVGTRYLCRGGVTAGTTRCLHGCEVAAPGYPDQCRVGDPCENADAGDGYYCGSSLGGESGQLYLCHGDVTVNRFDCSAGCQVAPPGSPDHCR